LVALNVRLGVALWIAVIIYNERAIRSDPRYARAHLAGRLYGAAQAGLGEGYLSSHDSPRRCQAEVDDDREWRI